MPEDLTAQQFADELGISRSWVSKMIKAGQITSKPFGKAHAIPASEVTRLRRERADAATADSRGKGGPGKPRMGRPKKVKPQVDEVIKNEQS